jgi:hypothetical protein
MRVELDVPESVTEPRMWVKHQPVLAMALRRGSVEMGLRRSEMKRRLLSKICGSMVAPEVGQACDIRRFPSPDRCGNHKTF